jgi:methionine aminopeptidase
MTREERNKISDKVREARILCDAVRTDLARGMHNNNMRKRLQKAGELLSEAVDVVYDIGTRDMAMEELTELVREIHRRVVPRADMCYNMDVDEEEE